MLRDPRESTELARERAVPGVKWVLCEPFVLDCGVVVDGWRQEIDERRAV
eukprot:COSAG02_NODE_14572_length_1258_cov_4.113028_2_plen_49_part_01